MTARAHPGHAALVAALAVLVLALFAASAAIGYATLDISAALADLIAGRASLPALVLSELRLPRAILGATVGFSLGITGAALQGLMRNPLADPGVVGVSGAAALGAVVAFYFGLSASFALALPLGGLIGAGIATAFLLMLARRGVATATLILAGVALNSLTGALTALALNLAPSPYAALEVVFWLMGSLSDRSLVHVALALPFMMVGWGLVLATGPALDALTLGEDTATSLGFSLSRTRLLVVGGAAAAVGASVAVAGAIGFVGLVVPHLMRPLAGNRPGRLLLLSGLAGAALTLGADIAVRLIPTRPELKLGVVTAIIGAPFFLAMLRRLKVEGE
ncbi:MAG TPA: iron ABC transporter permease [Xanthobacteraceae bacterium]|jgi:iron complex transport system permease protein|nr:MAG: ABC transporter permease [Rhizobiales bacterium 35-66-30]OZB03878.1 MAG: ABC transporter permease [Rhizobiales bacterium 39-66-18]HQS10222.1 iron ABC transporter permease [Xanthobacteraceae bacterium]HQS46292.1 iron ABC transporter permease [Xanthobacteraceae bacterium]